MDRAKEIQELAQDWAENPRWRGVQRPYHPEDVVRLRGSVRIEHTLARRGAGRFWHLLQTEPWVGALGALTGTQAVQMVQAGLQAIYVSGWQVAADANEAGQTYPDMSLYPVDSLPELVRRINNALLRADQIQWLEASGTIDWLVPIVADAEAGFGGILNTYELVRALIEAGAAAIHLEDQVASMKKCGHLGGKVLVPVGEFVQKLVAARLAADVLGVPTVLIARTDARDAQFVTTDIDPVDRPFILGERSPEGFYRVRAGLAYAIARAQAVAPYADMLWFETKTPDLDEARTFAQAMHERFPGKLLAYNCSPSFNWKRHLDEATIARFRESLAEMGYRFQFITLAGFHALNASMYELARGYHREGMPAYVRLQQREFELAREGYQTVRHQRFVGTGYFDAIVTVVTGGRAVTALDASTEAEQFE
ncbi:MAG: isocitrate lyase [Acidobacteria bacterium]|nr:isocitrate lyase [Acidobacteriota bacterium]MDW7985082.1 isocitrate lyase [Acidobacteriota bacterium]